MECTRQYQSTDVKVWDNYSARTLSFGKETAVQAIQQDNARVNTAMQQDIGELATQTSPLSQSTQAGHQLASPQLHLSEQLQGTETSHSGHNYWPSKAVFESPIGFTSFSTPPSAGPARCARVPTYGWCTACRGSAPNPAWIFFAGFRARGAALPLAALAGARRRGPRACNEALDQHYKAICVAGKSESIEALK
ncbi:hypothetical protein R3P38DRAFT_2772493 [Favolaschia claudopus]|uniref:Uncharacterized protein n=1 Tax=Favolaschia claudopus TaxID=2862362 RepID=A0AAW0C9T0_9AGAR